MTATRKPGRPPVSGRSSVYVHAPTDEIEKWRRFATRAERTLNGWIRETLNEAMEKETKR